MKSLSVSDHGSAAAKKPLASGFRPRIGHVLTALVLLGVAGWALLFLAIRLVVALF
jgi:hypothetical protein